MPMRYLSLILVVVGFTLSAWAISVPHLNQAVVPVEDHSSSALKKGLRQAFVAVLIKESGNAHIGDIPLIQNAMRDIQSAVVEYHYVESTDEAGQPQLQLQVTFESNTLFAILREAHQTIWGADRPLVVAMVQGETREVSSQMESMVHQVADQRGVPLVFSSKEVDDVMAQYPDAAILQGHVTPGSTQPWQSEWILSVKGEKTEWQNTGTEIPAVVQTGMMQAVDQLANRYATVTGSTTESSVVVRVKGVSNLDDYATLMKLLKQISIVKDVNLATAGNEDVVYHVVIVGSVAAFKEALNNSPQLTPLSVDVSNSSSDELDYTWKPIPPEDERSAS